MTCFSRKIIQDLRGRRSSARISEQMGFRSNVVYMWESGRRVPRWSQFVEYCKVVDRPFLDDFKSFFRMQAIEDTGAVFRHFAGDNSNVVVAKALSATKSTVSKWSHGQQDTPLPAMLDLISLSGGQLVAFLSKSQKFRNWPEIRSFLETENLFFKNPEAILLWNLVDLEEYQSSTCDEAWLAKRSGLSQDAANTLIDKMEEVGVLQKKNGRWGHGGQPICLSGSREQQKHMTAFWLDWAKRNLPRTEGPKYKVFTADHEAVLEIQRAYSDFSHRLGTIIEKAQKRPQTRLLSLVMALTTIVE